MWQCMQARLGAAAGKQLTGFSKTIAVPTVTNCTYMHVYVHIAIFYVLYALFSFSSRHFLPIQIHLFCCYVFHVFVLFLVKQVSFSILYFFAILSFVIWF